MRLRSVILICPLAACLFTLPAEGRTRIAHRQHKPDTIVAPVATADTMAILPSAKSAKHALSALSLDTLLEAASPTAEATAEAVDGETSIMGEPEVELDRMVAFVRRRNPDFDPEIARAFLEVGRRYGIRGDIALCQSILETGWFKFEGGTAVKPEQHNYCGLGVTRLGLTGSSFPTIEEGVTAQIQHLYAYACRLPLPEGEQLLDPRFRLVERGVAPTWRGLNRRWAANDYYSDRILDLFRRMRDFKP